MFGITSSLLEPDLVFFIVLCLKKSDEKIEHRFERDLWIDTTVKMYSITKTNSI